MNLFALLAVLVLGVVVGVLLGSTLAGTRHDRSLQAALRLRDSFIEHLRELAWRDRDVAPELSTVVLDEIRVFTQDPRAWDERRSLG